jgi:hypothetical protein
LFFRNADIATELIFENTLKDRPEFRAIEYKICRSQWPRGLRYELSSLARTLGSWFRIPLKAWMSVCGFFFVYVVLCVGSGLAAV